MATGEVYFNYGDKIKSKRVCEAISLPYGPGPICGFGSASINGNVLNIKPYALGDEGGVGSTNFIDPSRYLIRDLIRSHYLPRSEDADLSDYRITFGCIAKDGVLYRSGVDYINVNIEGSKGFYNQVLLFAEHRYVSEQVQNLVSFRAFWNQSDIDFFTLYKKSQNIYYPSTSYKASISDSNDPYYSEEMSYDYLINKVSMACPTYNTDEKSLVLIGIYGDGINLQYGNQLEKFAIVPYGGEFPVKIRYNSSIHSYFKLAISRIESYLDYDRINQAVDSKTGNPLSFNSLVDYFEWFFEQKAETLRDAIKANALPVGSIILYDGETIPDGWVNYDKASGRVVVGYTSSGIQFNTTSEGVSRTVLRNVGDIYDPLNAEEKYEIVITGNNLPKHKHGIGLKTVGYQNDSSRDDSVIVNYSDRDNSINGSIGSLSGISKGAISSGANIITSDPTSETTIDRLILSKLPPAITLRFIQKKS